MEVKKKKKKAIENKFNNRYVEMIGKKTSFQMAIKVHFGTVKVTKFNLWEVYRGVLI